MGEPASQCNVFLLSRLDPALDDLRSVRGSSIFVRFVVRNDGKSVKRRMKTMEKARISSYSVAVPRYRAAFATAELQARAASDDDAAGGAIGELGAAAAEFGRDLGAPLKALTCFHLVYFYVCFCSFFYLFGIRPVYIL